MPPPLFRISTCLISGIPHSSECWDKTCFGQPPLGQLLQQVCISELHLIRPLLVVQFLFVPRMRAVIFGSTHHHEIELLHTGRNRIPCLPASGRIHAAVVTAAVCPIGDEAITPHLKFISIHFRNPNQDIGLIR